MSMLVGLWTMGSEAQRVASSPSAGLILPADSSGLTKSEEHTSELQSPCNLVCRLLLEKKKNTLAAASAGGRTLLSARSACTESPFGPLPPHVATPPSLSRTTEVPRSSQHRTNHATRYT